MLNRRQFLFGAAAAMAGLSGCTVRVPQSDKAPEQPPQHAEGPRPFRVALLSDPHTVESGFARNKLSDAVADYKPLRPDVWLVNGDITDRGKKEEYAAFRQVLTTAAKPEQLLVNTGNHDFYDKDATDEEELARFKQAFGLSTPYTSRVAGGLHFVMLADEQYKTAKGPREWAWLTADQLRWFERVLSEHREKETIVALHQPLQDSLIWSHGGNDFAGCGQAKELRAILGRNPQVRFWLSGHTHMGPDMSGNAVTQNGVTFVGLGSTFYEFVRAEGAAGAEFGGFKKEYDLNRSRMLEVWPDRLVIRTRDHVAKAWMEKQELVLKRTTSPKPS